MLCFVCCELRVACAQCRSENAFSRSGSNAHGYAIRYKTHTHNANCSMEFQNIHSTTRAHSHTRTPCIEVMERRVSLEFMTYDERRARRRRKNKSTKNRRNRFVTSFHQRRRRRKRRRRQQSMTNNTPTQRANCKRKNSDEIRVENECEAACCVLPSIHLLRNGFWIRAMKIVFVESTAWLNLVRLKTKDSTEFSENS